jgi:PAS domain S-box-containing protein
MRVAGVPACDLSGSIAWLVPPATMNQHLSADLARALFEEAGDALFLFDPDSDQVLEVNPMAEGLCGFTRDELLRMPVTNLYRFEGQGGKQRLRLASQQTVIFHGQHGFLLRTKQEGVWVPVSLTITRLHLKAKTLALITARDVREQREAHTRVEKMEAELRRVMSSVSDCLWSAAIDPTGHWQYRYVSPVIEKITGRPAEFFIKSLRHWWGIVHADDRRRYEKALGRLRNGQPIQEEYRVVWPDGSNRWVRDSVLVSRPQAGQGDGRSVHLNGVLTDVTERKQAEEALARERALLRSLIDSIPDLIFYKDCEGRFLGCNTACEAYIGRREAEVMGLTDLDLFPADLGAFYQEKDRQVLIAGKPRRNEEWAQYPDGRNVLLEMLKTPFFDADGHVLGLIGISRDITERKQAEEKIKQTAEELAASNRQLQQLAADLEATAASEHRAHEELKKTQSHMVQAEKLASVGQLVAGIAHEINNPLAFVSNNIAVLQRDVQSLRDLLYLYQQADAILAAQSPDLLQRIRSFAEQIDLTYTLGNLQGLMERSRDGVQRIQQIVKALRDFARLDESELKEADLNPGIESTIVIMRGEARKKQVELVLELTSLPPVLCFPARLNQVVLNLVVNAMDACPQGGRVTVRTEAVPDGVVIHVRDTGHGIDPAIRDKIFDPFFTTKPPGKGTGLGLSISYQIVQDHGGRIEVESAPGQGTVFQIHLPLQPPVRAARREPLAAAAITAL